MDRRLIKLSGDHRKLVCLHRRDSLASNYRITRLGGQRGTAMTVFMSMTLLSIGACFGFVIAGIFSSSRVES